MEQFISKLKEKLNTHIHSIESTESDILQKSVQIITVLQKAFEELRIFIAKYTFANQEEEILFFKQIKPQIFSQLIYYNKVYYIEMRMPTGSNHDKEVFLENILSRIKYYFDINIDFYHYYRSGSSHLDKYYFLRGKPDIQLILEDFYFERDMGFSTSFDFKVSKLLANEMLTVFINNKLSKLHQKKKTEELSSPPKVKMTWTGKKAELVELIYAWEKANSFNHGNVNIKSLTEYIEEVFNIDLGDFYHTFLEMRDRKGSRTIFLDKLIKLLNDRMDEADNK